MTLLLNNNEIAQLITMPQCVEVLEDAYREHGLAARRIAGAATSSFRPAKAAPMFSQISRAR